MAARGKPFAAFTCSRSFSLPSFLVNKLLRGRNLQVIKRTVYISSLNGGENSFHNRFREPVSFRHPCGQITFSDLLFSRKFSSKSHNNDDNIDADEPLENEEVLEELRRERHGVLTEGHRLFVIQPNFKWGRNRFHLATVEHRLEEAVALVDSLENWKVLKSSIEPVRKIEGKHFFGKGKVQMIDDIIKSAQAPNDFTAVFIDVERLTPRQVRELESVWGVKIFDRFSVVLQIFKERAHTSEAKLQVDLAEIPYLRSRLVQDVEQGSFDQQRGGTHSMSGGGETKLELARRVLNNREIKLKRKLEKLRKRRAMFRAERQKKHLPIVSVIGYTNAGKTTLVKRLTGENEMKPDNRLFATLDVTHHGGHLPGGLPVLFVDTVGFLSDLPVELVECFAATLEDVVNSDVLLHVRDVNHPEAASQKAEVLQVLRKLNVPKPLMQNMIEVRNKIDLREEPFVDTDSEYFKTIEISAKEGTGFDDLVPTLEEGVMSATNKYFKTLIIPIGGPQLSWLHHETTVHKVEAADETTLEVSVVMDSAVLGKYLKRFEHVKTKRNKIKNKNNKHNKH